jgi:L-rhamnose mutarotase
MQRIGLLIRVKPEKLEEYRRIHANVWPELLAELKAAGIRNYSLWLRPDGLEFGYLECEDWNAACAYLEKSEVHTRWQTFMQDYLDSPTDAGQGGQPVELLEMSFLME